MNIFAGYFMTYLIIYIAGFLVGGFSQVDVVFGVTVPRHLDKNNTMKELKLDYRRIYGMTAFVLLAIGIFCNYYFNDYKWLLDSYVFVWFILTMYLYIIFHKKVKKELIELKKVNENNEKPKKRIVSASLENRDVELKGAFKYFAPGFIVIIITFIVTVLFYDQIPDLIPVHYNALGEVDGEAKKSLISVFGIQVVNATLVFVMYLTLILSVKYSRQRINPRKPETSRLQIKLANKRLAIYLGITSFLVSVIFAVLNLGVFESIDLNRTLISIVTIVPTIIIILGAIIFFLKTGIYGDRIRINVNELEKDVETGMDNDEGWYLGMFYYNKKDSSIFVARRFGGGFTVNFATLIGKLFIVLILIILILSIVLGMNQ